jgi:hypothetical protein
MTMATKKKASVAAQKAAKSRKAKAARDAKKGGAVNEALARANKVAGKAATATREKIEKGVDTILGKGKKAPQFFGRKKATAAQRDPEKVKAERNALHQKMMRVKWYAEHRAASIELWVARRAAQAAKDTAEVEKLNRKLERINKERDAAREAWVKKGSVIPDAAPVKAEKKAAAKKEPKPKAAKKSGKRSKKQPAETPAATTTVDQPVTPGNVTEAPAAEPETTSTDDVQPLDVQ